jgi:hypothetical protein
MRLEAIMSADFAGNRGGWFIPVVCVRYIYPIFALNYRLDICSILIKAYSKFAVNRLSSLKVNGENAQFLICVF